MLKKLSGILILSLSLMFCISFVSYAREVKILFTHDIHSYLDDTTGKVNGEKRHYGDAARLSTLLKEHRDENTLYLDGGDIAMGTLYQTAFSTEAVELRILGELGCDVTTLGNHEFDYDSKGLAESLHAALLSGDRLPELVQSNISFEGALSDEQARLKWALDDYGCQSYVIKEAGGVKVAVFGLEGIDSVECIQADVSFEDYIKAAKKTVEEIGDKADLIVCLSHSGLDSSGETGEDIDLARKVPGIDIIISAHSHTALSSPVIEGDTIIAASGSYLQYLGEMTVDVTGSGAELVSYDLIPIDENVPSDSAIREKLDAFKKDIQRDYLEKYAGGSSFDDVLCTCGYDMMPLDEMYEVHEEFPLGNLISDAYEYEAERNGINDIDVYLVGLGTIRDSINKGPVTVADAFEICSLGVGSDGSAGHPLLKGYITGSELRLLSELDSSLGGYVSSIKMSYNGLAFKFNDKRTILDRVTDISLVRPDGTTEQIEDDKLYCVCCNMYAANMLGMLNGLTKGAMSITPKDALGNTVTDFYSLALLDKDGKEIKEWVALKNYLSSFEDGKLPEKYNGSDGRKIRFSDKGAVLLHPGLTTWILIIAQVIAIALIFFFAWRRYRKLKKKREELPDQDQAPDTGEQQN